MERKKPQMCNTMLGKNKTIKKQFEKRHGAHGGPLKFRIKITPGRKCLFTIL